MLLESIQSWPQAIVAIVLIFVIGYVIVVFLNAFQ